MIRLCCKSANSWWPLPRWACGVFVLWGAVVVGWAMMEPAAEQAGSVQASAPLCLMRRVFDIPCAACGGTRAALALGRAAPREAWLLNPLGAAGMVLAVAWLAVFYVGRRRVVLEARGWGRFAVWTIAIAALLANWAWVVTAGRV